MAWSWLSIAAAASAAGSRYSFGRPSASAISSSADFFGPVSSSSTRKAHSSRSRLESGFSWKDTLNASGPTAIRSPLCSGHSSLGGSGWSLTRVGLPLSRSRTNTRRPCVTRAQCCRPTSG